LPKAGIGINRTIYFYEGELLEILDKEISKYHAVEVETDNDMLLKARKGNASIFILQGKPISEPVMKYGPFVMNSKEEIHQAFNDYHSNQFGGWPWPRRDQVHSKDLGRFAKHANGKEEIKTG
jgi:redox-sensitive bicupin YhaK (pirin superfamily)